jgi:hypothetical protein
MIEGFTILVDAFTAYSDGRSITVTWWPATMRYAWVATDHAARAAHRSPRGAAGSSTTRDGAIEAALAHVERCRLNT